MSVVAAAVVGSGLVGAYSANKAAGAQKSAAKKGNQLQKQLFDETNALQKSLYEGNVKTINKAQGRTEGIARDTRTADLAEAASLRNRGRAGAATAYQRNSELARDTRNSGVRVAGDTRDSNIDLLRQERADATARLRGDRAENIDMFRTDRALSLKPFQETSAVGHNALDANAYNLGIGSKPAGYSGLELSPGAQFALEQGRTDVEGGAASRGQLDSGATLEALEHLRSGTVMQDRDNQQAQLLALAGLGNSADSSMAGIRGDYADRIAGARTGATSSINSLRGDYADDINGQRDSFADRFLGLNDTYANRQTANENTNTANVHGIDTDYYSGVTGANDAYGANATGAINLGTSNLLNAATNRANLQGTAATQYANGASQGFQAMGDASAGGAINTANALNGTAGNLAWLAGQGKLPPLPSFGGGGGFTPSPTPNWLASIRG